MNKIQLIILALCFALKGYSQSDHLEVSLGINAVDFYPVGGDEEKQGPFMKNFFSVKRHYNITPTALRLTI